jgi:hypothetical protein
MNGKKYIVRPLEPSDFSKGFLALLAKLATVGNVSEEEFTRRFGEIFDKEKKRGLRQRCPLL